MDNRQLIMEKALELFCARGYDAVGVQEIAEQSGITKPTLYYYFGSKQGLMETILEENSRILEEMLEKAVEEPGDVPQVLYRVARAYFDFAGSHWQFYLFMLSQFYSGKMRLPLPDIGKRTKKIQTPVPADPEILPQTSIRFIKLPRRKPSEKRRKKEADSYLQPLL